MDYAKFKHLISIKETSTCDFKIDCGAFASRHIGANAELAKDIIAMCNNGSRSYILVGISDDGQDFKSVANAKLTDDNLQTFCKTTIMPSPKVSLCRVIWPNPLKAHKGIEFVIIEVGP